MPFVTIKEETQMKRVLALILAVLMLMTCAAAYTDVPEGAYYEKNLTDLAAMGVVEQTDAFRPNEPCTRGQFVTWLHNLAGKPAAKAAGFTDVAATDACAKAVDWAKETGITTGMTETVFGTENTVTRAQMVTFMHRYATKMAYTNMKETTSIASFADSKDVAQYAQAPMAWAVAIGMVKGNTDNTLTPNAPATRAHAIAFIGRLKDSQTPVQPVNWDVDGDGELSILSIGNSYSDDAHEFLYEVLTSLGIEKVHTANLYVGGCTLEQHAAFLDTDVKDYSMRVYSKAEGKRGEKMDLIDALKERSWDYITLQQGTITSGDADTYNSDLTKIVDFVRKNAPKSKFAWHMTWSFAYSYSSTAFLKEYGRDQMKLYHAICSAVQKKIVEPKLFDYLIPVGTAIQNARSSKLGDTLNRDGYHLSADLGRYIAALSFAHTLTGLDISGIGFAPAPGQAYTAGAEIKYTLKAITSEEKAIAIESVLNAAKNPLSVTQSAYPGDPNAAPSASATATRYFDEGRYFARNGAATEGNFIFFDMEDGEKIEVPVKSFSVVPGKDNCLCRVDAKASGDGWVYIVNRLSGTSKDSAEARANAQKLEFDGDKLANSGTSYVFHPNCIFWDITSGEAVRLTRDQVENPTYLGSEIYTCRVRENFPDTTGQMYIEVAVITKKP